MVDVIRIPDTSLPQELIDEQWKKIEPFFPYPAPRPHQKESMAMLNWALEQGYKNIIFEAPVGSGKSVSAMVMGFMRGPFFALTPNIGLQKQYLDEFGSKYLRDIKGRRNFMCETIQESAELAPCIKTQYEMVLGKKKKKKLQVDSCPNAKKCKYLIQKKEAIRWGHGVISNPAYMLRISHNMGEETDEDSQGGTPLETKEQEYYVGVNGQPLEINGERIKLISSKMFQTRDLCIFDEAHNLESIFIDMLYKNITVRDYALLGRKFPKELTVDFWTKEIQALKMEIKKMKTYVQDIEIIDRLNRLDEKLSGISFFLSDGAKYVTVMMENNRDDSVRFQPRRINRLAPWYYNRLAKQRIFVSATMRPFDKFCHDMGLKEEETIVISITESPFQVEHRMTHCLKIGQMSRNRIEATLPRQLDTIKQILEVHQNERGVILPFTHKIREQTVDYLNRFYPDRILTHGSKNHLIPCPTCGTKVYSAESTATCPGCGYDFIIKERDYILNKFMEESTGNHVFVSTYVGEGFDLGGKKNIKFLIIQKVPYPDLGATDVKDRVLLEQDEWMESKKCNFEGIKGDMCQNWGCRKCNVWYNCQAARKIQQMAGRIVRTPEDVGAIYILDSSFSMLYNRNPDMFSEYFKQSVEIIDIKK